MEAKLFGPDFTIFEVSIEIINQKDEYFEVAVSRISNSQIYAVTVGFVIAEPFHSDEYSLEVVYKV